MRFTMLMIPRVYSAPTDPNFAPRDEVLEWARRIPAADGDIVDVRRVLEYSDYPVDVQAVAENDTVKAAVTKK